MSWQDPKVIKVPDMRRIRHFSPVVCHCHDLYATLMCLADQFHQVGVGTETLVNLVEINDIVSAVRWIESARPVPKDVRLAFDVDAQNLS